MSLIRNSIFLWISIFLLAACARAPIPSPAVRVQHNTQLAITHQWHFATLNAGSYVLAFYAPKK